MTMRVAIVHDWLTGMRGGEKVLEGILSLYPSADVFTLVHVPGSVSPAIEAHEIRTSFVQRFPGVARRYRTFLPLFPAAIERFDLSGYDLVLSSSHCVAKGVRVPPGVPHVCYCHTPMRYIWDQFDAYFGPGRGSFGVRSAMRAVRGTLQRWDVASSARVGTFIANSRCVADRIRSIYGRDATVIHPWVDHAFFTPGPSAEEGAFLVVSALVPYKNVGVAIEAFRGRDERLVVVGDGPERRMLEGHAPANVTFRGHLTDDALRDAYRGARALLFPGLEDFGIVPLEAMACGTPVIALGRGGALETVVDGVTGTFVPDATAPAFAAAVDAFDPDRFDAPTARRHAVTFDRARFLDAYARVIASVTGASEGAQRVGFHGAS